MKALIHISAGVLLSAALITAVSATEQNLSVPSTIKEGATSDWININSDNDNKRCVKKIAFSGHTINSSDMASLKIIGDD